jgi:CheY-like chemotaxis protein
MLSSAGTRGDADYRRTLGIEDCLMKPVKQSALLDAIMAGSDRAAATDARPVRAMPVGFARAERPLRVLVAEDNLVNQRLAVHLLEKRGHTVVVVGNGREALAALDTQPFDAVLMDVQMPGMDGLEATAAIREKEKTTGERVPVVAMTAHAMKRDRERCLEAGMDGYVSKPLQPEKLFEAVEGLPPAEENAPTRPPETDVVDGHALLALVGGDRGLVRELVTLFHESSAEQTAEMAAAIRRRDRRGLGRAAHSLKGSLANLRTRAALRAARRLESLAGQGDFAEIEAVYAELQGELRRLMPALDALCGHGTGDGA